MSQENNSEQAPVQEEQAQAAAPEEQAQAAAPEEQAQAAAQEAAPEEKASASQPEDTNNDNESGKPIDLPGDSNDEKAKKELEEMLAAERQKPSIGRIQDEDIRKLLEDGTYGKDADAAKSFAKYVAGLKKDPVDEIKRDKAGNITGGVYEIVDGKYRIDEQQAIKAGLDGEMYVNRLAADGKTPVKDTDGNPIVDVIVLKQGVITNVIKGAPEDPKNPNLGTCSISDETINKAKTYQTNLAKAAGISSAEQSTTAELPRAKTITDPSAVDTINRAMIDQQGPDATDATVNAFKETVDKAVGIGEGIKLVRAEGGDGKFKLEIPTDFNGVAVVPHLDEHGKPKPGVDVISIKDGVITNGLITEGSSLDDGTRRAVAKGAEVEARNIQGLSGEEIARRANVAAGRSADAESIYLEPVPVTQHTYQEPDNARQLSDESFYDLASNEGPVQPSQPLYETVKEALDREANDTIRASTSDSLKASLEQVYDLASPASSSPAEADRTIAGAANVAKTEASQLSDIASAVAPIYDLATGSGLERQKSGITQEEIETAKRNQEAEILQDQSNAVTALEIDPNALPAMSAQLRDAKEQGKVNDELDAANYNSQEAERARAIERSNQEPTYDNMQPSSATPDKGAGEERNWNIPGQGDIAATGPDVKVHTVDLSLGPNPVVNQAVQEVRDHVQDPKSVRSLAEVSEAHYTLNPIQPRAGVTAEQSSKAKASTNAQPPDNQSSVPTPPHPKQQAGGMSI